MDLLRSSQLVSIQDSTPSSETSTECRSFEIWFIFMSLGFTNSFLVELRLFCQQECIYTLSWECVYHSVIKIPDRLCRHVRPIITVQLRIQ